EVLRPIGFPRGCEGPPGGAGGVIGAAYLDEVLAGAALANTGGPHVTGEVSVRYLKLTPLERPILGRGRAIKESAKYVDVEGTLEDLETGELFARAIARFFPMAGCR